jgi:hypothetical protein
MMESKILFQIPSKLRVGFGRQNISKKLNGNEYAIDGDTLYLKLFTENKWVIISEIDYRVDFISEIQSELLKHYIFFDPTEIFREEGIL